MHRQSGFSLVELVVVLAVVAVIASFIVPRFGASRATAQEDAARSTAASLLAAISAYYMTNECYPREVGPNTMPSGLAAYVGGQWPVDFDYQQQGNNIGVSWRPGGTQRWTVWLTQGVSVPICP
ncbi:MAG: prepilin-type N-terminal cleavage/methylation domain-containing protein [Armatimonadota bacterium]|nr:prepilin-type N-terminal cleavage/methylation domain-containing protein [Armatimonadota bacterium]MDR7613136.1 prepilin-type N-terminal cleavage/methylation domain-containing protein [Armatimonadota bacterium]